VFVRESWLTVAFRTISYGVSCMVRTLIRVRRACRLKPAPGIHVGMCLTVKEVPSGDVRHDHESQDRRTSRKEVDKD
jgi:hypothetical protein